MMIIDSDEDNDNDSNIDTDSNDDLNNSNSTDERDAVQQRAGQQVCFTSCAEVASSGCECQRSRASKAWRYPIARPAQALSGLIP